MCLENFCITVIEKYSILDKPRKYHHSFESESLECYFSEFLLDYVDAISNLNKDEYIKFEVYSLYYDSYENRYFENEHIRTITCKGN